MKYYNYLTNRFYFVTKDELQFLMEFKQPRYATFDTIKDLFEKKLLLTADQVWDYFSPNHAEIETSSVCNWRCLYCPVSYHSRSPIFIQPAIYKRILDQLTTIPSIRTVSLHAYNEPTIDPHFFFYVRELVKRNLHLRLFTNGSGLDEKSIRFLEHFKAYVEMIVFNYPSCVPERFREKTGSNDYQKTTNAIHLCCKSGLRVFISVQATADDYAFETAPMRTKFTEAVINAHHTTDRAGLLKGLPQHIKRSDPCAEAMLTVYFDTSGSLYACCHDFHKETIYANIKNGTLIDLFHTDQAKAMRKQIVQRQYQHESFLCSRCENSC